MHYRDVYVVVIGNRVRSLIRTPKGRIKCVHCKDAYVIETGNTVSSLIRTLTGQHQVCALQRYLCYSDTINTISSPVVNTNSKRTVSIVCIKEMSML